MRCARRCTRVLTHTHTRILEQPPCCPASCILLGAQRNILVRAGACNRRKTAQPGEKALFNIVGPRYYVPTTTVIIRSLFGAAPIRASEGHRGRRRRRSLSIRNPGIFSIRQKERTRRRHGRSFYRRAKCSSPGHSPLPLVLHHY